ncbi:hypothetical protein [Sediminicoccus sp. BL-A-41-H5]|uniref:hypothetical protein n=1 Tax=Sediminicoccus sp. BL-A-41-H5 TaxID=3421106 RepID=UPI003D674B00
MTSSAARTAPLLVRRQRAGDQRGTAAHGAMQRLERELPVLQLQRHVEAVEGRILALDAGGAELGGHIGGAEQREVHRRIGQHAPGARGVRPDRHAAPRLAADEAREVGQVELARGEVRRHMRHRAARVHRHAAAEIAPAHAPLHLGEAKALGPVAEPAGELEGWRAGDRHAGERAQEAHVGAGELEPQIGAGQFQPIDQCAAQQGAGCAVHHLQRDGPGRGSMRQRDERAAHEPRRDGRAGVVAGGLGLQSRDALGRRARGDGEVGIERRMQDVQPGIAQFQGADGQPAAARAAEAVIAGPIGARDRRDFGARQGEGGDPRCALAQAGPAVEGEFSRGDAGKGRFLGEARRVGDRHAGEGDARDAAGMEGEMLDGDRPAQAGRGEAGCPRREPAEAERQHSKRRREREPAEAERPGAPAGHPGRAVGTRCGAW